MLSNLGDDGWDLRTITRLEVEPSEFMHKGTLKLSVSGGHLRIWDSRRKNFTPSLTWDLTKETPPDKLYVEGVSLSGSARDCKLLLSYSLEEDGIKYPAEDKVLCSVYGIKSVEWKEADDGGEIGQNSGPGGGKMIYPDKNSPDDDKKRDRVNCVAALNVVPNFDVNVHFKLFDVDDPSADNKPIDDESDTTDNFGTDISKLAPKKSAVASRKTGGKAETVYHVSMQPGDNFRAVAAISDTFFNGIYPKQKDSPNSRLLHGDEITTTASNCTSEMLTIWRRLWIECDSMSPPQTASDLVPDTMYVIPTSAEVATGKGWTKIQASASVLPFLEHSPEKDMYEGGIIETKNIGNLPIIRSTKIKWLATIELTVDKELSQQEINLLLNRMVKIKDDDDTTILNNSRLTSIPETVIDRFSDAYIKTEYMPDNLNVTKHIPFVLNFYYIIYSNWWTKSRDVDSSEKFWTACILNMYQPTYKQDYDSDTLTAPTIVDRPISSEKKGVCLGLYQEGVLAGNNNVAMAFWETIRDYNVVQEFLYNVHPIPLYEPLELAIIFTHELGHTGGLDDGEGGIMGEKGKGSIPEGNSVRFSPFSIRKLRNHVAW